MDMNTQRTVSQISHGMPTSDGAGVKLTRIIGHAQQGSLDPFLMLDEFGTDKPEDYIAGFPSHPHRGFETVTYMLKGRMRHRDNHGGEGLLVPGSVQWMTAGRGIVHSEMPEQIEGEMRGFQLWVNLPAKDKMQAPRYQDIAPERIPEVVRDGCSVRVIAGEFEGVTGPVSAVATEPVYLDVALQANAHIDLHLPTDHRAFIYVFEGSVQLGDHTVQKGQLATLTQGDVLSASSAQSGRFILVAGKPINEPIAWHGPFVMNTQAEIQQAVADFRAGRF
jgi:quercetin 2,3-dioxygenase